MSATLPRHLTTALLATALLLPALSASAQPVPTRENIARSVQIQLSGFEHVPKAADWARIGPPELVAEELMRRADAPGDLVQRLRAMSSLKHFPTPTVERFLLDRAGAPKLAKLPKLPNLDVRLRGRALMALGGGFLEAKAAVILPYLADRNPRLREDAVRALRFMAAPEIEAFLKQRRAKEPLAHVRATMLDAAAKVATNRAALVARKLKVPRAKKLPKVGPVRTKE